MRRRKRKLGFKFLIFIFVVSLFCFSIGYSLLEQQLTVNGKGSLVFENDNSSEDFKYSYKESTWGAEGKTARQYDFTIQNIKPTPFIGWTGTIELDEGDLVKGCWNVVCTLEGNILKLKNESYNGNVPLNGEVSFGIIIWHVSSDGTLKNIKFSGIVDENEVIENDSSYTTGNIEVTIEKGNSWGSDSNYSHIINVTVKNSSDKPITSWQVDFVRNSDESIDNISAANYIEMTDIFRFSNVDWNGYLSPGATTTFQFFINNTKNYSNVVVSQASGSGDL